MRFPIPDGRALEACRDLASDVRKLAAQALEIIEAIESGDATAQDRQDYEMIMSQIKSMGDLEFQCVDTKRIYIVRDYVTARREMLAVAREARENYAYEKLARYLN